jgi:hypothetical protein
MPPSRYPESLQEEEEEEEAEAAAGGAGAEAGEAGLLPSKPAFGGHASVGDLQKAFRTKVAERNALARRCSHLDFEQEQQQRALEDIAVEESCVKPLGGSSLELSSGGGGNGSSSSSGSSSSNSGQQRHSNTKEPPGWAIRREQLVRDRYLASHKLDEVCAERSSAGAKLKAAQDEAAWLLNQLAAVEKAVLSVHREDSLSGMGESLETLKIKFEGQARLCEQIQGMEKDLQLGVRCMHERMGDMVRHVQGLRAVA